MDGAFYPVKGSQEISRAIIPTIEAAGGRVFVKAPVAQIVIESGRAVGVKMADSIGENILVYAKQGVISAAGVQVTQSLVEQEYQRKLGLSRVMEHIKPGVSHIMVFVGLNGNSEDLELRGANLWVLPVDSDYNFLVNRYKGCKSEGEWEKQDAGELLLFIGFPSAKDPCFSERHPGKSTCEIITECPIEWVQQFISSDPKKNVSGKRKNDDYKRMKEIVEEKIMSRFYELYPKCQGKVDYIEVGTPLSNQYYLGRAASYGLEHTPERYGGSLDMLRYESEIKCLYMTGQDVCSTGIAGALNSGILTAHAVLGYGVVDLVICKRNLIQDIMDLEKPPTIS